MKLYFRTLIFDSVSLITKYFVHCLIFIFFFIHILQNCTHSHETCLNINLFSFVNHLPFSQCYIEHYINIKLYVGHKWDTSLVRHTFKCDISYLQSVSLGLKKLQLTCKKPNLFFFFLPLPFVQFVFFSVIELSLKENTPFCWLYLSPSYLLGQDCNE